MDDDGNGVGKCHHGATTAWASGKPNLRGDGGLVADGPAMRIARSAATSGCSARVPGESDQHRSAQCGEQTEKPTRHRRAAGPAAPHPHSPQADQRAVQTGQSKPEQQSRWQWWARRRVGRGDAVDPGGAGLPGQRRDRAGQRGSAAHRALRQRRLVVRDLRPSTSEGLVDIALFRGWRNRRNTAEVRPTARCDRKSRISVTTRRAWWSPS